MIDNNFYLDGGALVADPNNSQVFYSGGTALSGTYYVMAVSKTTNGGTNWTRSYLTTGSGFTYAIAVDRLNSNIIYAGGNPTLYKSTNGGLTWFASGSGITGIIYDIKVNPQSSSIVYAGTTDGVFKSTNGGNTWIDMGLDSVNALLMNPVVPDTIYAGCEGGVYISTNAGSSWTLMNSGLYNTSIKALGVNPGVYLFAGTGEGAYRQSTSVAIRETNHCTSNCRDIRVYYDLRADRVCFSYILNSSGHIAIDIYDVRGSRVKRLLNTNQNAGEHTIVWQGGYTSGKKVPEGVYFCRIITDKDLLSAKFVICR